MEQIKLFTNAIGGNINNLAIINSTLHNIRPSYFSGMFSPNALVLKRSVITTTDLQSAQKDFLFHFPHQMTLVAVEDSTVNTSLTVSFMKTTAKTVLIQKNQMNLAGGVRSDFQLVGDDIVFSHNKVTALRDKAVKLMPSTNLLLQNNQVDRENILYLLFPEHRLDSITILKSKLGLTEERLKKNFIKAKVSTVKIEGCILQLDSEGVFVVESDSFLLQNNHLIKVATSAFEVKVHESIEFLNNTFDHCEEKAFFYILPLQNCTQMRLVNNTFLNPEDGFLKLSPEFELNLEDVDISNMNIHKPCSCDLPHDMITETITLRAGVSRSANNPNITLKHTDIDENHLHLETLLIQNINCIDTSSQQLTKLDTRSICFESNKTSQPYEITEETKTQTSNDSDMIWLIWLVLGIVVVAAMTIFTFLAIRTKMIEKRAMNR